MRKRRKTYFRQPYKCTVKEIKYKKYGIPKTYGEKRYSTIVLDKVVIIINSDVFNKLYSEMKDDELISEFGTSDINELLTEKIECDKIKGKLKIDLEITEQTFRRLVFDYVYNQVKYEKQSEKFMTKYSPVNNSHIDFDFTIPNSFSHLDLTKKLK